MFAIYCLAWELPLRLVCFSSETLLENTNSTFASNCNWDTHPCRTCACCHSLWEFIHVPAMVCLKCLDFLVFSISFGSYPIFTSFSRESPKSWGKGFDGDILFRAECFKFFHTLHIVWLWIYGFLQYCCRRKLLRWWVSKEGIHEHSRMSIGVILLLHSFIRTVSSI